MSLSILEKYPLVSVLIPAYNHTRFIKMCLNSILTDGYPNLEVLILDDGSTDDTYAEAENWLNLNGSQFTHYKLSKQSNRGVTKTLNTLMKDCSGDYFVLLASDDMLLQGGIANRLATLQSSPRALAAFGDASCINEDNTIIFHSALTEKFKASISALLNPKTLAIELILHWSVPGPVFMARRVIIKEIGLYNQEYSVEDRDYYLRIIAKDALIFTSNTVAAYRIHTSSSTGTKSRQYEIGKEVKKIELAHLAYYKGLKWCALWLACNGSFANIKAPISYKTPFYCLKVIPIRILSRLLRNANRVFSLFH